MQYRCILAAVALLCVVAGPAQAQKTKAQLNTEIGTNFPDNTSALITPQNLRTVTADTVNSIMPNAPVVSGNLACFNGTTGLLQDCGTAPVVGPATSTDKAIVRFSGATGKILQNSAAILDDSGNLSTPGTVTSNTAYNEVATSPHAFRLQARTTSALAFPVPTLQPITNNIPMALDITPSGPSPTVSVGNGYAWYDACDADLLNDTSSVPTHCARLAIAPTGVQIGSAPFNGASTLPIEFLVDYNTVKARMTANGFQFGSATRSPVAKIEATDDTITSFLSLFSGEGTAGTLSNHPFSIWTNNTKRAIFDTAGNLSGLLSLQRTGGVAIQGTNTNDNAAAGYVGEYITSAVPVGSAVPLTTATPANCTSISLTAGDWEVVGTGYVNLAASTSWTDIQFSISGTSATLDVTPGRFLRHSTPAQVPGATNMGIGSMTYRLKLAGTTTIYMVEQASFTVSTAAAWCYLAATRVR